MTPARWWIGLRPKNDAESRAAVSGDLPFPSRFEATVIADATRGATNNWPPITMEIEVEGGRPVIRQLTIGSEAVPETTEDGKQKDAGREEARVHARAERSRQKLLRELPLARLAKYATIGVAIGFGEGPVAEELLRRLLRDDVGFYRVGPERTTSTSTASTSSTPRRHEGSGPST